ncbi:hypothetical protein BDR26DRAFT_1003597 [Obelidium mucronatum]|nr:hypothetical protein BDR26DRAFT_1003597 [Obelidium mucronatum]
MAECKTTKDQKERLIVALVDAFFSTANLVLDPFLENLVQSNSWVPISLFESPVRLGDLAFDEVVVAKAVSNDGKALRLKKFDQKTLEKKREKMVYFEQLPAGITVQLLCKKLKNVRKLHVPLTSIFISRASKKSLRFRWGPVITGDRNSQKGFIPKWTDLIQQITWRKELNYINDEANQQASEVSDIYWEYTRSMPMTDWRNRMTEYQISSTKRRLELKKAMIAKSGKHECGAVFQSGVVAAILRIHRRTNRRILKQLFELIGPVSFVDHSKDETHGYVRFKTPQDATAASSFFSRQEIVQIHSADLGTLVTSANHLKKLQARHFSSSVTIETAADGWGEWDVDENSDDDDEAADEIAGIKLQILEGREELEYWKSIRQQQREHVQTWDSYSHQQEPIKWSGSVASTYAAPTMNSATQAKDSNGKLSTMNQVILTPITIPKPLPKLHIKFDGAESPAKQPESTISGQKRKREEEKEVLGEKVEIESAVKRRRNKKRGKGKGGKLLINVDEEGVE